VKKVDRQQEVDETQVIWVYENLGSSSYFDNLWDGYHALETARAGERCAVCDFLPCLALPGSNDFDPPWWTKPKGKKDNRERRHACYKEVKSSSIFRSVIHSCWLFGIRLRYPGGPITGYKPRHSEYIQEEDEQNND